MADRNTELHFEQIPATDVQRSRFIVKHSHKTTMNEGDLVPIMVQEILPGDTFNVNLSKLVRMTTPIFPVLDNCHMDTYAFYVPNRLLWQHWEEFCGANKTTYWTQPTTYTIPQVTAPPNGWQKGTIADYMGIPIGVDNISINALPFRAYAKIYNDWFWNENIFEPQQENMADAVKVGNNSTNGIDRAIRGGFPLKVGRVHDYFSTCLPEMQRGNPVQVPLGNEAPLKFSAPSGYGTEQTNLTGKTLGYIGSYYDGSPDYAQLKVGATDGTLLTQGGVGNLPSISLVADLSQAIGINVAQIRESFQVQRYLERCARSGTRYIEWLKAQFGVTSSDARLQRAEYLGGNRTEINMTQVIQQSATSGTSPQGNAAAYSLTIDSDNIINKSFEEHGFVLVLACIRVDRTYQQGIERFWSRKELLDYYLPVFANLSEQAVLEKEIYATGTSTDDEVFGYQEAWSDYRHKPNRISGELRSQYAQSLDSWHYGDYYNSKPVLGRAWFEEDKSNINRTLAVQTQDQFICDFFFDIDMVRPMPIYSVPGLIDHN